MIWVVIANPPAPPKPPPRARRAPSGKQQAYSLRDRHYALLASIRPMLELVSTVDAVFDEDDAMSAQKRQMGMGRIYEAWKDWRESEDPDYNRQADTRGNSGTGQGAVAVRRPARSVLQRRVGWSQGRGTGSTGTAGGEPVRRMHRTHPLPGTGAGME